MASKTKLLKKLLDNGIFIFEDKKLKSGQNSPYYCNFRKLLSLPELFAELIEYIENFINKNNLEYDLLCGVPTGAVPLCSSLAFKMNQKQIMVRDKKKDYGMKNLIDGDYEVQNKILLLEDVLTTGGSILETIEKLKKSVLEVTDVIVLFDRNQEGSIILEKEGINVHALFNYKELINYIESSQLKDIHNLELLKFFYDTNQKNNISFLENYNKKTGLTKKELMERDLKLLFSSKNNRKLIEIIKQKKTTLCLSLDVPLWKKGKEILDKVGPYICMVKFHCELMVDWDFENTINEIKELSTKHNFLIMQDSKFIDVPKITEKQYKMTKYQIHKFANYITVHWENFIDIQKILKSEINLELVCVAEMNTLNHNFNEEYYKNIENLIVPVADKSSSLGYSNNINSIVSQSKFKKNNNVLKFTPGVIEKDDELKFVDEKRYRSIENAMVRDRNHIVIIGSNIIDEIDYVKKCKNCSELSWYYFNLLYKKIIDYENN